MTVDKAKVMTEVAMTTSYVGAKMEGDAGDYYDKVFTTDEDAEMLERFWSEAASAATDALKEYVTNDVDADGYAITLRMPENFDTRLVASMEASLFSYFTESILAKWFLIANKSEAEGYTSLASGHMDDVTSKLYHRVRPTRPNDVRV